MLEQENTTTAAEDEDILLPDGWGENDDIFNESGWTGESGDADARGQEAGQTQEKDAEGTETAPTTGQEQERKEPEPAPTTGQEQGPGDGKAAEEAPTTGREEPRTDKLRFRARVDHQDQDVELDESELPNVYQRAQATERAQKRLAEVTPKLERAEQLARAMGYESLDNFLENAGDNYQRGEVRRLVSEGVHEEVAKDMIARRFAPQKKENDAGTPAAEKEGGRDFAAEARALMEARPDLAGKKLPDEVIGACVRQGKSLLAAYSEYEIAQQKAEADRLRRENEVLRQNAASAARAPVSGVSGGGKTDTSPEDDFLKGFESGF